MNIFINKTFFLICIAALALVFALEQTRKLEESKVPEIIISEKTEGGFFKVGKIGNTIILFVITEKTKETKKHETGRINQKDGRGTHKKERREKKRNPQKDRFIRT